MHIPNFDPTTHQWDRYRRFHTTEGWGSYPAQLVRFDTGEAMLVSRRVDADSRGILHRRLNVAVYATTDFDCPKLLKPDGTPIPRAWLTRNGGEHLLMDYCTGRVVSLWCRQRSSAAYKAHIPASLRDVACVYWPGSGEPPVGPQVRVRPSRTLTPEQRNYRDSTLAAAKAWAALREYAPPPKRSKRFRALDWTEVQAQEFPEFQHLSEHHRLALAYCGWDMGWAEEWYDYLLLADGPRKLGET